MWVVNWRDLVEELADRLSSEARLPFVALFAKNSYLFRAADHRTRDRLYIESMCGRIAALQRELPAVTVVERKTLLAHRIKVDVKNLPFPHACVAVSGFDLIVGTPEQLAVAPQTFRDQRAPIKFERRWDGPTIDVSAGGGGLVVAGSSDGLLFLPGDESSKSVASRPALLDQAPSERCSWLQYSVWSAASRSDPHDEGRVVFMNRVAIEERTAPVATAGGAIEYQLEHVETGRLLGGPTTATWTRGPYVEGLTRSPRPEVRRLRATSSIRRDRQTGKRSSVASIGALQHVEVDAAPDVSASTIEDVQPTVNGVVAGATDLSLTAMSVYGVERLVDSDLISFRSCSSSHDYALLTLAVREAGLDVLAVANPWLLAMQEMVDDESVWNVTSRRDPDLRRRFPLLR